MKRDMDLVRNLLLATERADCAIDAMDLYDEYSNDQVAFHVEMMTAHGLIDARCKYSHEGSPLIVKINGLTWEGYDYLDAIRSDSVWQRSKAAIKEAVGDAPLSVIKEVCSELASAMSFGAVAF